jgi:predicted nucleotidyltransferase component of viral defense system
MNFHLDREFEDAVNAASEYFKLRAVLIEKDYWVTYVLKNLSLSEFFEKVIFKGGTSLSKAYNCIERFSEDIDLALLNKEKLSNDKCYKLMKRIEPEITKELQPLEGKPGDTMEKKRVTYYSYPRIIKSEIGVVKDKIQIEINTFTNPVPYEEKQIQSFVGQFLFIKAMTDLVTKHQLEPFRLLVLTRERTFFEKLLSLIRLSYTGIGALREKIRHFYDMYKLYQQEDLGERLFSETNFKLINLALQDDASSNVFTGDWIKNKLSASPLFIDINVFWKELESTYRKELGELIWHNNLPSSEEIISLLKKIKIFLEEFDKLYTLNNHPSI